VIVLDGFGLILGENCQIIDARNRIANGIIRIAEVDGKRGGHVLDHRDVTGYVQY
jgi:hypothetical protein